MTLEFINHGRIWQHSYEGSLSAVLMTAISAPVERVKCLMQVYMVCVYVYVCVCACAGGGMRTDVRSTCREAGHVLQ